ncbi:hypothetical protein BDFB_010906 [Asbolus verrucosus]|uniref:Uncharacterized protein n=1 Tax=Asbolus verrucosus TaxID=1661398 RepID=A0A482VQ48_ASBVE|nr:hypothetical protein BDFB_010906 [Asbolus verrucosus]
MITRSFDGKRSELQEFIRIWDIAYKFAANHQKEPLLGFILSNITGHASAQIQDKVVHNWHELNEILQQFFSEKKTESQLMEELNTLRQKSGRKNNVILQSGAIQTNQNLKYLFTNESN